MRPTAWVSFLAVFLLTAAVTNGVADAHARPAATKASANHLPSWVVKGDWMPTNDEAVKDALDKARAKVTDYLRSQSPPMEWLPDPTWIQTRLMRDLNDEQRIKELEFENCREWKFAGHTAQVETEEFKGLGEMRRAAVLIEVSPSADNEIKQQERLWQDKQRQERAASRQGVLARVLAGVVALLAAVACYLRLEDATKGYYTTLLRLAAVAFVALVGAGVWLLT